MSQWSYFLVLLFSWQWMFGGTMVHLFTQLSEWSLLVVLLGKINVILNDYNNLYPVIYLFIYFCSSDRKDPLLPSLIIYDDTIPGERQQCRIIKTEAAQRKAKRGKQGKSPAVPASASSEETAIKEGILCLLSVSFKGWKHALIFRPKCIFKEHTKYDKYSWLCKQFK